MQVFSCHTADGIAFGQVDGLPFSAQWRPGKDTEILFEFAAAEDTRALAARLKKEKRAHLRWFAHNDADGHTLAALYQPPSDFYAKAGINNLLRGMAALQKQGDIAPPETCPLCGLAQPDACAYLSGAYRPVHAACVETRLELPEKDETIPASAGGNVFTGIWGALLGAFIGALPIFTFALNNGTIHWVLYAFIPILSGLCYRLLRGKASAAVAGVAVLAASLLAALGLELIWFWLLLSAEYGQPVPFLVSAQRYFASHTLLLTVREMLACLLALFAGYMAVTIFLRRYVQDGIIPKHVVRGAAYVRGTLSTGCGSPAGQPPEDEDTKDGP